MVLNTEEARYSLIQDILVLLLRRRKGNRHLLIVKFVMLVMSIYAIYFLKLNCLRKLFL